MDGLLIVDKPPGPTSHDVVARVRLALREKRIGHTGTLDPMASGVLPLVVGRATRLARFIGGDKAYDATIRLGLNTDSGDALGVPVGAPHTGPWPDRATIDAALDRFRGTFHQQPPAFSAKKIAGRRSYAVARKARAEAAVALAEGEALPESDIVVQLPDPVEVTTYEVVVMEAAGDSLRLSVRCSAGFYIRSLAVDLGAALGTGAHLTALRRTEAAGAGLERAVALDQIEAGAGASALVPLEQMLTDLPAVWLTEEGVAHVRFGRTLGPADASGGFAAAVSAVSSDPSRAVRLLAPSGQLVAMAGPADTPGLLHPGVVLL